MSKQSNIFPEMYLERTSFAYEETLAHLNKTGRNPLIEAYLSQYLLVAFYAEVEERVREIILNRLSQIEDRKVASFVFKTNEGMLKRINKSDINDVLNKFDCGEGDVISKRLDGTNLQPYFDALANRHKVSHAQGSSMTLEDVGKALSCGEVILEAMNNAISNE